jgi:hypothetical protein
MKSEQPKAAAPVAAPRRVARVATAHEEKPAPAAPAPPRNSVEVIEGAKKRSVDFPPPQQ